MGKTPIVIKTKETHMHMIRPHSRRVEGSNLAVSACSCVLSTLYGNFSKVHLHKEAEFGKPWKGEQRLASLPSYCLKRLPNAVRPPLSKISAVSVSCRWNICVHRKTGLGSKFEVCTRPQIGNFNYSYYLFYRSPKKHKGNHINRDLLI